MNLTQIREGRRSERSANRRKQKDDRHADRRRGRQWERPSLIGGLRESLMGRGPDGKPQTLVSGARGKLKDSTGFARVRDVGRLSPGGITHGYPLPAQPSQPNHAWRTKERGIEHDRDMMQAMVAS